MIPPGYPIRRSDRPADDAAANTRAAWAKRFGFAGWDDFVHFEEGMGPALPTMGPPPPGRNASAAMAGGPIAGKRENAGYSEADAAAERLCPAAFVIVTNFAAGTPGAVKAVAVTMLARYIANTPKGIEQLSVSGSHDHSAGGGDSGSFQMIADAGINAFRRSGAQAMCARYRRRRAKAVG